MKRFKNIILGSDDLEIRTVIKYTRENQHKKSSFVELLRDGYNGIVRSNNILDNILGIDEKMEGKEKPIKIFRLIFEFDNRYWSKMEMDYLSPKMNLDEKSNHRNELRVYLNRCDDILKDVYMLADEVEKILS